MTKELFRELFQNYIKALHFKKKYFHQKMNWSKYTTLHRNMLDELDSAEGSPDEQFKEMKRIDERYFKTIRGMIFDIPYIPITYEDDIKLPKIAQVSEFFQQEIPTLPLNIMGGAQTQSYDFFNLLVKFFSPEKPKVGGKDPGATFTDPITKNFYSIIDVYYNIITNQIPSESAKAWKILKGYTDILNNLEKEYKSPRGSFRDYLGENKKKKYIQEVEKNILRGYQEFNALASVLQGW